MSLTRSVAKGAEAQFSITKIGHLDSKIVCDTMQNVSPRSYQPGLSAMIQYFSLTTKYHQPAYQP